LPSAREIVDKSRREIVKDIIENMKKGYIFSEERWNKDAIRPQNPVSKAKYQGVNRFRLAYQAVKKGYTDPRWITFLQATENGWKVKDKEKGTLCEKWIWTQEEVVEDEEGNKQKITVDREVPIINYFVLFNAEQIEGIPKLEKKELTNYEILNIADNFIKSSECPIQEAAQEKAYYSPSEDKIVLPLRKYFKSEESFLATLLHEMSHSTGHKSRLDRSMINIFGTPGYAKEELRAELGAMFLEADLNVDLKGANKIDHANYLKSWISVLEDNPDELFKACNDSSKISERLIDNYNKCIELGQKDIKQVQIVVLNDEKYGDNSLWKVSLNELNKNKIGEFITNLSNEELEVFDGYIKENHSSELIYNNLLEYLEKNQISFEELCYGREFEEAIGG